MPRIAKPSLWCAFLEMYFDDRLLASGSGFVGRFRDRTLLITAKHNVTGRDANTGQCLHPQGAVPNLVRATIAQVKDAPEELGNAWHRWISVDLPLGDASVWQSSNLDPLADIAFAELPVLPGHHFAGFRVDPVMYIEGGPGDATMELRPRFAPLAKLAMAGYPFGKGVQGYPIWVSALLASEIDIQIDGRDIAYIDCRSRRGQSGSPVFFWGDQLDAPDDGWTMIKLNGDSPHLIGVYSGRINSESDIGIIWKTSAIIRSIENATRLV